MIFDEKTVFSADIKKPEKIKNKLNNSKGLENLFLVVFRGDNNKPEIYQSLQFKFKAISTDDFLVIGVFKGEDEAFEFIRELTELSVNALGDFDYRKAFSIYEETKEE